MNSNKVKLGLLVAVIFLTYLLVHLTRYNDALASSIAAAKNIFTEGFEFDDNRFGDLPRVIVFPKDFDIAQDKSFIQEYQDIVKQKHLPSNSKIIKYNSQSQYVDSTVDTIVNSNDFNPHNLTFFNTELNIGGGNEDAKCKSIEDVLQIDVSKSKSLDYELRDIIRTHLDFKSPYLQEVKHLFEPAWNTHDRVEEPDFHQKWFRLAGTSVWLEQYGVHYMISRIIYTPRKAKNNPLFSLSFIQIFDKNWKELKNIELILPTNENVMKSSFTSMVYPTILPIPFYFNPSDDRKNYGPEDPRLILTRNEKGYEEPLIITNEYHKQFNSIARTDGSTDYAYYRSMFLCYPWQFQVGKNNIDKSSKNSNVYNKIVELKSNKNKRLEIQKNWTPFFDYQNRHINNYDKEIHFVYRWENLVIYKCSLERTHDDAIICDLEYQMNSGVSADESVGALRGGTELINFNELIDKFTGNIRQLELVVNKLPKNRQIWFGFARAHLKGCGCTTDIYRPNFVVITKDDEGDTPIYKISHISSFMSLDIPMKGWDQNNVFCGTVSALIPNGISDWIFEQRSSNDSNEPITSLESITDRLTLSYSISDDTVEIVHIKGLIKALLKLDSGNPYYKLFEEDRFSNGYNNDNVECAIRESYGFCADFGEDVKNGKPSVFI